MRWLLPLVTCGLVAGVGACNAIFGVDGLTFDGDGPSTGVGGSGAGVETGGADSCTDGQERACYEGPPVTENVGPCRGGIERCDGGSWTGSCEGQVLPEAESCATAEDDDCDGANCGDLLFATSFGLAGDQSVRTVLFDPAGSMVVAGTYDGDLGLDSSLSSADNVDGYVAVFDPAGVTTSVVVLAGGPTFTNDVALGPSGDLIVVGGYVGNLSIGGDTVLNGADGLYDGYVARITRTGQVVWVRRLGAGGADSVWAVDYHPSGGLYIGGSFTSGSLQLDGVDLGVPGASSFDAYVIRLDDDGNPLWARGYGGGNPDNLWGLAVAPDGGVTLALEVSGDADLGLPNQGGLDAAVARLDGEGNVMWARAFGSPNNDGFDDVVDHPQGGVVLVGTLGGPTTFDGIDVLAQGLDAVAVALDDVTGAVTWVTAVSGPAAELGTGIAVDDAGRVYVGGAYEGPLQIDDWALPDATDRRSPFVARLLSDGSVDYAFGWLADSTPIPSVATHGYVAVAADGPGSLLAGGSFTTSIDFGGRFGVVPAVAGTDAFLLRLAP